MINAVATGRASKERLPLLPDAEVRPSRGASAIKRRQVDINCGKVAH